MDIPLRGQPESYIDNFGYESTILYACQYDQRFSYYAYIPSEYDDKKGLYSLAVIMHGTLRLVESYRDAFIDFAEKTNTILLVPVFPAAIGSPDEVNSYKLIRHNEI